jgi:anti-anti-sigma factor
MALRLERLPGKDSVSAGVIVVRFAGGKVSLDEEYLYRVRRQLLALADEPSPSDVLLDFGNVEYLTSTTLSTLVRLHQKLRATGRHLTVSNLCPEVHEVFAVTRLVQILDLRLAEPEGLPAVPDGPCGH